MFFKKDIGIYENGYIYEYYDQVIFQVFYFFSCFQGSGGLNFKFFRLKSTDLIRNVNNNKGNQDRDHNGERLTEHINSIKKREKYQCAKKDKQITGFIEMFHGVSLNIIISVYFCN